DRISPRVGAALFPSRRRSAQQIEPPRPESQVWGLRTGLVLRAFSAQLRVLPEHEVCELHTLPRGIAREEDTMTQDQITLAALDRIERELEQQTQVWEAVRSTLGAQDPETQFQLPEGFLA